MTSVLPGRMPERELLQLEAGPGGGMMKRRGAISGGGGCSLVEVERSQ